jgi:hypothetical protein
MLVVGVHAMTMQPHHREERQDVVATAVVALIVLFAITMGTMY